MHWPSNVLELLFTYVLERDVELVAHLVVHDSADTDPARLGERFEAGRDVDPVAEDVASVADDVSEVDADAELDPPRFRNIRVARGHPSCTSTAQRTASTTLENSISNPSPVVLTIRPRCSLTFGSPSSRRIAFSAASVPSSSSPISRE